MGEVGGAAGGAREGHAALEDVCAPQGGEAGVRNSDE